MAGAQGLDDVVQVVVPRLQDAVASEIRNLAQELAARADEARAEAEAEHEASLARERERAAAKRATAVAAAREQGAAGVASRLRDRIRRLDERTTLSGVLDALAELAAAEAGRAAVFVAVEAGLQVWRVVGWDAPDGGGKQVLTASETGVVGRAIGERRSVPVARGAGADGAGRPPVFALLPKDRAGVAVPVPIGGEPLVAVYAEEGTDGTGTDSARWTPVIEILASHAGSRLEAVAAARAAAFARQIAGR